MQNSKEIIDKKGKVTLKDHRTEQDEIKTLRDISKKLSTKQNIFEANNDFAIVPISRGYKKVLLSKFIENRGAYEKEATGRIFNEKTRKTI